MGADEPGKDLEWVRSRVLHVVGHELRTPITTLRGLADALVATETGQESKTQRSEERVQLAGAIQRNARRLETLVDDLLAAARVTTSLPVGAAQPVHLGGAVRQAWNEVGRGDLQLNDQEDAHGLARQASVSRILRHVLDNAAKYGTSPVTVHVSGCGPIVHVEVDSPGPELPPEDLLYATEPFWRGERAVTTAPGLGLGLAVAQTLIAHEDGALIVEARRGGGLVTVLEFHAA